MADDIPLSEWAGGNRRTLGMVFTDVVQGTRLGTNLGDDRMAGVKERHYQVALDKITEHNGRLVKTGGDAVFAVFKTAGEAITFAQSFHSEPGANELRARVRAGVHVGEVSVKDTPADVWGSEVDFAARVVGYSKEAELWLSDQAMSAHRRRMGGSHPDLSNWEKHDSVTFRGFEDEPPVTLWQLGATLTERQRDQGPMASLSNAGPRLLKSQNNRRDFAPKAVNYEEVDFVGEAEVSLDKFLTEQSCSILAQIDFEELLYVESINVRAEFGIKRAYLLIYTEGRGQLRRVDYLRSVPSGRNVSYKTWQDRPDAICICIEPDSGRSTLGALALPKWEDENRFALVATASSDIRIDKVHAELHVTLHPEQIYLADAAAAKMSASMESKLQAILKVAAAKKKAQSVTRKGHICRPIEVTERSREN